MSNPDPKSQAAPASGEQESPDVRFRYIGFDVFPKHVPKFWKSDQEAMEYAKRASAEIGESSLNREFSLLRVVPVSKIDRALVTIVSVIMLATVAMPWVHYRMTTGVDMTLNWFETLNLLMSGIGEAFAGGLATGLGAILALVVMIATPLLGIWTLAMLWRKTNAMDSYLLALRRPLKLGTWVFLAGFAVFVLSLFGGEIPSYESWGLIEPGEHYGIATLAGVLSYGGYTALAMCLIAGVKSGDL